MVGLKKNPIIKEIKGVLKPYGYRSASLVVIDNDWLTMPFRPIYKVKRNPKEL